MLTGTGVFKVLSWLLGATIKGSVVIAIVALLQLTIGPRLGARWRHALWLIVLLRLALPFAPSSSLSIFNLFGADPHLMAAAHARAVAPTAVSVTAGVASPEVIVVEAPALPVAASWLMVLWLAGVLFLVTAAIISSVRMQRAVRQARRDGNAAVDSRLESVVAEARQLLGIGRAVAIVECDLVTTPALHGLRRPTLLFPSGLAASFDRDELRHIVLHELWHLRRGDVAVSWILSAIQALHWFNPFVWFAMARIREERELACDELALSCLEEGERLGYGRTVLKLLERFRTTAPVPALVGIVNHKQQMKRRLTMIASYRNRTRFSILFLSALVFVTTVALTDATAGERFIKKLDPAAHETMKSLHQQVDLDLSGASLNELISAVSNKTGVVITQSPDVAASQAQSARFTLKAEKVPAMMVLHEALAAFGLMPSADANGVAIVKGEMIPRAHHALRGAGAEGVVHFNHKVDSPDGGEKKVVHVIQLDANEASPEEIEKIVAEHRADGTAMARGEGDGNIELNVLVQKAGASENKLDENGRLHRELTVNLTENGVSTEGKLTLDIEAPPTN
jgi:beta-lactamase regulating signal transducer with metallopeptidase domain